MVGVVHDHFGQVFCGHGDDGDHSDHNDHDGKLFAAYFAVNRMPIHRIEEQQGH